MLLQGWPTPYLASLRRMREVPPELRTIVPGHGPVGDGPAAIDWLVGCLYVPEVGAGKGEDLGR